MCAYMFTCVINMIGDINSSLFEVELHFQTVMVSVVGIREQLLL
jgi:hypothetical protein